MTSYEGLYLSTSRSDEGREVLRTSAATVSEGMLANTADTGSLEYNTVDGTLWFLHAIDRHVAVTGDDDLGRELAPVVEQIVAAPRRRHPLRDRRRPGGRAPATGRRGLGADVDGRPHRRRARHAAGGQARRGERALDPRPRDRRPPRAERRRAAALVVARRPGASLVPARGSCGRTATGCTTWSTGPAETMPPSAEPAACGVAARRAARRRRRRHAAVVDACARELLTPLGLRSLSPSDSALQAAPPRRAGRTRRRVPPGHCLAMADRAVRRRRAPGRRLDATSCSAASRRTSATGVSDRSRRRPTAPRRTPPPAVLSRPGRSPRSYASAARPRPSRLR